MSDAEGWALAIQDTIDLYESNKLRQAAELLSDIETQVQQYFEHTPRIETADELEQLTIICHHLNNDPVINFVREARTKVQEMLHQFSQPPTDGPALAGDLKATVLALRDLIAKAHEHYSSDQIHPAAYCLLEAEKTAAAAHTAGSDVADVDALLEIIQQLNADPILIKIKNEAHEIADVMSNFTGTDGWIAEKDTGPIRVFYKREQLLDTITLRLEGTIDVPLFNILSLVYESDLYSKWIPFCKQSKRVAKLARSRQIISQLFSLPPPVSNRELCLWGYGIDALQTHDAIMIVGRSCDEDGADSFMGHPLPPKGKNVRMSCKYLGFHLTPLSPSQTHLKIISNLDMHLKFIPVSMINFFTRKLASTLFKKLKKLATSFEGSIYQQRIAETPEFYGYLDEKLKRYFQERTKVPSIHVASP